MPEDFRRGISIVTRIFSETRKGIPRHPPSGISKKKVLIEYLEKLLVKFSKEFPTKHCGKQEEFSVELLEEFLVELVEEPPTERLVRTPGRISEGASGRDRKVTSKKVPKATAGRIPEACFGKIFVENSWGGPPRKTPSPKSISGRTPKGILNVTPKKMQMKFQEEVAIKLLEECPQRKSWTISQKNTPEQAPQILGKKL